jgi:3-oxoacyl-[acyl-carrier-protein] synthase-1
MKPSDPLQETRPVSITGLGVFAATGDRDVALWGAVATCLSSRRPVVGLKVPFGRQGEAQPYFAPIAALPQEIDKDVRIRSMAGEALAQACSFLTDDRTCSRILVLTLLAAPSPEFPAAGNLDRDDLADHLRETHPALAQAEIRFAETDAGATVQLARCVEELHRGEWDAVLFGGVDSLIGRETIMSLAIRGRCCTDKNPDGILPGEGAAYLLLEKPEKAKSPMAVITGLGHAIEANQGKADNCRMTALISSIEQALSQAKCISSQVETIVLPKGNDVSSALEWHQVKRKLWCKPEDDDAEMEELTPQGSIGDTGAASLPLSLIIGCTRFDFTFPSVERILVCEVGQGEPRGAVFLKKGPKSPRPSAGLPAEAQKREGG